MEEDILRVDKAWFVTNDKFDQNKSEKLDL